MTRKYRVAADIGGTFTDLVVQDAATGDIHTGKVLSTPANPATAVLEGVRRFVPHDGEVDFLVHGTTVGLNAILTRGGARVALVTTRGFRDVYPIAGNDRAEIFSLTYRKPVPLVRPYNIFGIDERLAFDGTVLRPPRLGDLDPVVAAVKQRGIEAVAVCLLFSYLNPAHENAVGEALRDRLPGVPVALSHEVSPEWREYARTSTTVLNSYVAPTVTGYLSTLIERLADRQRAAELYVMQSNGGVMTAGSARRLPVQTLLSGPVGGAVGAAAVSATLDHPNLICVDMGGTSFDASLVVHGSPSVSAEATIEGLPVQMSIVDIHVIGAGGGSIAWLEGDALRVGPHSAGAEPGPACYGRGGTLPTVTDANLVLGRIDEQRFAAGGVARLHLPAAREAIQAIGARLGMAVERLADGILDVVNAKMADAIRTITVQRGIDPRDFALVAYGGAGPMHAAFLARELDIREVLVPVHPGTFSAWGMLHTDIRHDLRTTYYVAVADLDRGDLERRFAQLEADGRAGLAGEVVDPRRMSFERALDLRYVGQEYALTVPIGRRFDPVAIRRAFDRDYDRHYGHANPEAPVEIVKLRVTATGRLDRPETVGPTPRPRTPWPTRPVRFDGTDHRTTLVPRAELTAADRLTGPAVIEEPTATTVVPPAWDAWLVAGGHLSLTPAGGPT